VETLQKILNFHVQYYGRKRAKLKEDGIFGSLTLKEYNTSVGPESQVSEEKYKWLYDRWTKGIPIGRNYNQTWPLFIGHYGDKVKALNVALGLYPSYTTDEKVNEFTQLTEAKIQTVLKKNSVSQSDYTYIMQMNGHNPALIFTKAVSPFLLMPKLT
jgi:hypothetical protein